MDMSPIWWVDPDLSHNGSESDILFTCGSWSHGTAAVCPLWNEKYDQAWMSLYG